jgi:hypothetical protein
MLIYALQKVLCRTPSQLHIFGLVCCALTTACQTTGSQAGELPNHLSDQRQTLANSASGNCKPFKQSDGFMSVRASFDDSGKYCLTEDLVQRRFFDIVEGRKKVTSPKRNGVISAFNKAHDLDVDLQGHLVTGAPFDDTTGVLAEQGTSIIKVHNGVVRTPGLEGVGVAMAPYTYIQHLGFGSEDHRPMKHVRYDRATKKVQYEPTDPWNYLPPTNYTAENLQIESGGRGVIMSGTGNVLRNNVIEVESATAAYLYGPGTVIEGNTFIVHQTKGEPAATIAILKLRDAHGAVIRNNRFMVKGVFAGKAEAAINLLESKDVVIEGNTIEGAKTLVRKDAASTTVEKGNEVK